MATETVKKIRILDPEKEERRIWTADRQGLDRNRHRSAEVLFCFYCNGPIGPDQLMYDRNCERACSDCAQK